MADFHANVPVQNGSERSFGIVFAVVFGLIGLWPLLSGGGVRLLFLLIAAVFLVLAFAAPAVLRGPNRLWFRFGMFLGAIVAPLVMALTFLAAFVPMGLLLRLRGKDLLALKLEPEAESYWIEREAPPNSMKRQF